MQKEIKKHISIKDYLANQGIFPTKEHVGYGMYKSPFRDEQTPSFKVDYNKNLWHDFGSGEGGSIVDLVMKMQQCNFIQAKQFLSIHSFKHLSNENQSVSFLRDEAVEKSKIKIIEIKLLQHPGLLRFLQSRKIDIDIATVFCKEVQYQINGRNYFALGFPNDAGGNELRNPQFKGCIPPKEITIFDRKTFTVNLFEGFMDYLSLLTLQAGQADVSAIILNSVNNLEKAIPFLAKHTKNNVFLDNDEGGKLALQKLQKLNLPVVDISKRYVEFKDVNDYLCGKKLPQFQKKQKIETEKTMPKIGKRIKR